MEAVAIAAKRGEEPWPLVFGLGGPGCECAE